MEPFTRRHTAGSVYSVNFRLLHACIFHDKSCWLIARRGREWLKKKRKKGNLTRNRKHVKFLIIPPTHGSHPRGYVNVHYKQPALEEALFPLQTFIYFTIGKLGSEKKILRKNFAKIRKFRIRLLTSAIFLYYKFLFHYLPCGSNLEYERKCVRKLATHQRQRSYYTTIIRFS